jgi:hypothetical protein
VRTNRSYSGTNYDVLGDPEARLSLSAQLRTAGRRTPSKKSRSLSINTPDRILRLRVVDISRVWRNENTSVRQVMLN